MSMVATLWVVGALLVPAGAPAAPDPRDLSGLDLEHVRVTGADEGARALDFVRQRRSVLAIGPESLVEVGTKHSGARRIVRFAQVWRGVPVRHGALVVTLEGADRVAAVTNDTFPIDRVRSATIDAAAAARLAAEATGLDAVAVGVPKPVILARPGRAAEGWEIAVVIQPLVGHLRVVVDGAVGRVIGIEEASWH